MWTILDLNGKVLFAKFDNEVLEGQVAIEQICILENPEQKDIFFNFETKQFYLNEN
jgi:hypothetical protein